MRFKVNKSSKFWLVTMLSAVLSSWTGLAHSQTQTQTLGQAPAQIHDEVPALNAQLWNDILNDRATAVMKQLAAGLDPNIKSKEGQPAVMWAIQNNSWQVYDLLRQHKNFDVNITNINNETPLMYLAILGELARGQQLVQQGAKINRLGWTPLHYAASKGQLEFARWLLDQPCE